MGMRPSSVARLRGEWKRHQSERLYLGPGYEWIHYPHRAHRDAAGTLNEPPIVGWEAAVVPEEEEDHHAACIIPDSHNYCLHIDSDSPLPMAATQPLLRGAVHAQGRLVMFVILAPALGVFNRFVWR